MLANVFSNNTTPTRVEKAEGLPLLGLVLSLALMAAIAALVISSNSRVMLAWRSLLYSSVRSLMSCFALSVAFFIATIRELCSLALASSRI